MFRVSVVIATRDRARWLEGALESLVDQTVAAHEVVVVDNGSHDDTQRVAGLFRDRLPGFQLHFLEPAGLSAARNLGIEASSGEAIAFLDDDARASPRWVESIVAAFERDESLGALGGPVQLSWPGAVPSWLSPEIASLYAALDLGPHEVTFSFPLSPYGVNMAVRRSAIAAAGAFSMRIGRVGRSLISGDDGELCWRIEGAGFRVVYDPDVRVVHDVQEERTSPRWLVRRAYDQGLTRAIASGLRGLRRTRLDWLRLVALSIAQTVSTTGRAVLWIVTLRASRPRLMTALVNAVLTSACALQALRISVHPSRYAAE